MKSTLRVLFLLFFALAATGLYASGGETDPKESDSSAHGSEAAYDPVGTVMNHIADANEVHFFGHFAIPLPVMLYAPNHGGWKFGTSNMFHHGTEAVDGYVLNHGRVNRVATEGFPAGHVKLDGEHPVHMEMATVDGKEIEQAYVMHEGNKFVLDKPSTLDGGLLGGGITSFYDFSITKNVFTMFMATLLLFLIFTSVARSYKKNAGKAPSGFQSLMEPVFLFIRDEVARPMIGDKHYERFTPFIMSLFFFILVINLMGLIPFLPGGTNVTGNLGVTMALALMVLIMTTISGKKDYWRHTFAMPGVPWYVLIILTPVEILGLFIKPFSLMIRLFANISAGHIIILSLIGLIFVFGGNGTSVAGATTGAIVGGMFTAFMNLIELLVAFLQAFIFAMLAASYIGAAVEEHDHHDEDHAVDHHHGGAHAEAVAHH